MTKIHTYQRLLLSWYGTHGRSLPWRNHVSAYEVFVSEIMLQQTQVERVLPKFAEFLALYPTIQDLATAENADLLRIWQGMGYNSRVLRMKTFAHTVCAEYGGVIPQDRSVLMSLPGIGPYTSGAILCFGYDLQVSFIDTNVKRIIHRVFEGLEFQGWQKTDKELLELAKKVTPIGSAFDYHQALMDLGSSLCKATKLQCDLCPLQSICATAEQIQKQPQVLLERKSYKKTTVPFKESRRFIRGGVVDFLREEPSSSLERIRMYVDEKLRPMKEGELEGILSDLVKEGLLKQEEDHYFL